MQVRPGGVQVGLIFQNAPLFRHQLHDVANVLRRRNDVGVNIGLLQLGNFHRFR